jgi:hypothetical protein
VKVVWTEYGMRELIISPYRLVYRVDRDQAVITMVVHERREFPVDDKPWARNPGLE